MYSYYAYGLGIHSDFEIPEFINKETPGDVSIVLNCDRLVEDYLPPEVIKKAWALHVDRQQGLVYVKDVGLFTLDHGSKIVFTPTSDASEAMIRFYLVGTVMAIILYQRQFLVLHGSVIEIDGQAVIFLGNSGDGKSSVAAALHARGYKLINDDVAPVSLEQEQAILQPGFPQIKMGRETAKVLNYDFESLPLVHPAEEKRNYRTQYNCVPKPMTIRRIYVLGYSWEFAVKPIPHAMAVKELSRHSRPTTLYHQGDALHFFQCANLVKQQTIYHLVRPKNLELLPQIVDFIEKNLAENQLNGTTQTTSRVIAL
ncbi:MAG: hypothetical protein RLZZ499_464 [Cyanobacteriota bacterium]